jgi:hypothetical protein
MSMCPMGASTQVSQASHVWGYTLLYSTYEGKFTYLMLDLLGSFLLSYSTVSRSS